MITSNNRNKVKRIHFKDIENKKGVRFACCQDEFECWISFGIVLDEKAINSGKMHEIIAIQRLKAYCHKLYYYYRKQRRSWSLNWWLQ